MNATFLLLAQYEGRSMIPADIVARDFFGHLSVDSFVRRCNGGEIDLPLVRADNSAKAARYVHVADLAAWIDKRREAAKRELEKING